MTEGSMQKLGKYKILEEIGKGGFATVYKARDTTLERTVAIKILRHELLNDPVFVERFEMEAKMAARLEHPNIVRIYEVGEFQGIRYLAMEYVEGQPLAQVLQSRGRLTAQQVLKVVKDVASALDAAHGKGMIHRDIKPSNILIRADGTVLLTDFGLAKAVAASFAASLSSTSQIIGTLRYMSPEQAEEKPLDHRADLYALGIVLYEMLVGQPPFLGETAIQLIRAHADKEPPPPSQFNKAITPAIESVVLRALTKAPDRRYSSAGQMAQALDKAITHGIAEEHQPTPRPIQPKLQRPSRRRAAWIAIAGILLFACAIAVGFLALLAKDTGLISGVMATQTSTTERKILPTASISPPAESSTPQVVASEKPPTPTPTATKPTSTLAPSDTTMPTPTPTPSNTPTHTPTATPTDTPAPTDTPLPAGVVGPAWIIETQQGTVSGGKERLEIALFLGNGQPVAGQYFNVFHQRRDLASQWVTDGGEVAWGYTDNTGLVTFDLPPDSYIIGADFKGYNWGDAADVEGKADVPVEARNITRMNIRLGQFVIGFRYGDGTPIRDQYVSIYKQKQDLAGNWVTDGGEAAWANTDNTGVAVFNLAPGPYIVASSFRGYNWGDAYDVMGEANVEAMPGQVTTLIQDLGQLSIGLLDASKQPKQGVYVSVYKQRKDVAGNWTLDGSEVAWGSTDNRGIVSFNLTPGLYAVQVENQFTYSVPVEAGKTTVGEGHNFTVQE